MGDAAAFFAGGLEKLPDLYADLQAAIERKLPNLSADGVYLTEYPNAVRDGAGNLCRYDPGDSLQEQLANLPGVSLPETEWADTVVQHRLREAIEAAAAAHGWNVVDGIFDAFARHGYCADEPWLVRLTETFRIQGNVSGAVHPNAEGHAVYADRIAAFLTRDFYSDGDPSAPRPPGGLVTEACAGDCDADDEVTADEIVHGVNIALGVGSSDDCEALDRNRDTRVTIDELVEAVNAVLDNCGDQGGSPEA
jgi:hypothetical protein